LDIETGELPARKMEGAGAATASLAGEAARGWDDGRANKGGDTRLLEFEKSVRCLAILGSLLLAFAG